MSKNNNNAKNSDLDFVSPIVETLTPIESLIGKVQGLNSPEDKPISIFFDELSSTIDGPQGFKTSGSLFKEQ